MRERELESMQEREKVSKRVRQLKSEQVSKRERKANELVSQRERERESTSVRE